MKTEEKLELLKDTIHQLYSKEGRSLGYIAKLLMVNRQKLSKFIKENKFEMSAEKKHLTPSNQKFLNKNRTYIKSKIDSDVFLTEVAKSLGVTYDYLLYIIKRDDVLRRAEEEKQNRLHKNH